MKKNVSNVSKIGNKYALGNGQPKKIKSKDVINLITDTLGYYTSEQLFDLIEQLPPHLKVAYLIKMKEIEMDYKIKVDTFEFNVNKWMEEKRAKNEQSNNITIIMPEVDEDESQV